MMIACLSMICLPKPREDVCVPEHIMTCVECFVLYSFSVLWLHGVHNTYVGLSPVVDSQEILC